MSKIIIDELKHEVAIFKSIIAGWNQVTDYHELNDAQTFITRLEGIIRGFEASEEKWSIASDILRSTTGGHPDELKPSDADPGSGLGLGEASGPSTIKHRKRST